MRLRWMILGLLLSAARVQAVSEPMDVEVGTAGTLPNDGVEVTDGAAAATPPVTLSAPAVVVEAPAVLAVPGEAP